MGTTINVSDGISVPTEVTVSVRAVGRYVLRAWSIFLGHVLFRRVQRQTGFVVLVPDRGLQVRRASGTSHNLDEQPYIL